MKKRSKMKAVKYEKRRVHDLGLVARIAVHIKTNYSESDARSVEDALDLIDEADKQLQIRREEAIRNYDHAQED
jgi:hypothetical protein